MKKWMLFAFAATFVATNANSQWWEDAGLPGYADGVTEIYEDTTTNTMYCMGAMQLALNAPYVFQAYHEGTWTTSDPFDFNAMTIRRYHDTVIVAGHFTEIAGQSFQHIAAYVNGEWIPYGTFDQAVYALRVLNGELYAVGIFNDADGQWCGGVAKHVGGAWVPVGNFPANDYPGLTDITIYQGNLVVTGTVTFNGLPYKHIIQYDGQEWGPLGQGILTSMGGGDTLAVYHGELYVGGFFRLSEGNAGHCIMRWNGQAWHPVGTSIQDETGGYNYAVGVRKLLVKDDLLFACGGFNYAGNVPAAFTATWDGDRWCGFGGSMDLFLGATTLGFYGDTLFVGCGNTADGQPVNHLVRYIGDTWGDSCSVPMGDLGMGLDKPALRELPRLADLGSGMHRVVGEVPSGEMRVFNEVGQLVCTLHVRSDPSGTEPFSLAGLTNGYYVLDLEGVWRTTLAVAR